MDNNRENTEENQQPEKNQQADLPESNLYLSESKKIQETKKTSETEVQENNSQNLQESQDPQEKSDFDSSDNLNKKEQEQQNILDSNNLDSHDNSHESHEFHEKEKNQNTSEINEINYIGNQFDKQKNNQKDHENIKPKKTGNKILGAVSLVCLGSIIFGIAVGFSFGFGGQIAKNFLLKDKQPSHQFEFPSTSDSIDDKDNKNNKDNNDDRNNQNDKNISSDLDVASLFDSVSKSVVVIDTVGQETYGFFGEPIVQSGSGTGVIFTKDDKGVYIVTNNHVIENASEIKVKLEGIDKKISAKLMGSEESSDLAVIYLDKTSFERNDISKIKIASFGDSDPVRVGDSVVAIGNALGEGIVPAVGTVSAKDKEITISNKMLSVMQISASINRGNSGGALINKKGEVIGITTAKYSGPYAEGVAYCIPINDVKSVIESIMSDGDSPVLGIQGVSVNQMSGDPYVYTDDGVFISSVLEGSSAEKAGLKIGDVIVKFDGKPVKNFSTLQKYLRQCKVGDKVILHVLRMGSSPDIEVTLSHSKREMQQKKEVN